MWGLPSFFKIRSRFEGHRDASEGDVKLLNRRLPRTSGRIVQIGCMALQSLDDQEMRKIPENRERWRQVDQVR